MNKNERAPVIVMLDNGDTLFTETDGIADENDFMTLYLPHRVTANENQILLMQWVPFSEDEEYFVHISKILNVCHMDEQHKRLFGSVVATNVMRNLKDRIVTAVKLNVRLNEELDILLSDMLMSLLEISNRYNMEKPKLKDIHNQFYSLVSSTFPEHKSNYVN